MMHNVSNAPAAIDYDARSQNQNRKQSGKNRNVDHMLVAASIGRSIRVKRTGSVMWGWWWDHRLVVH